MRIAIINLTGGGMSGGYRKYLRNIIPKMAKNRAVGALLCASPPPLHVHDWFELIPNVEFINCQPFRFVSHGRDFELYKKLNSFSPDVIFVPTERYFRFNKIPVVNMVQNMEPLIHYKIGNPVSERLKNWLRAKVAKEAVRKANRVIAVSEFVKDFLVKKWQTPVEKIGIVYHGLDSLEKNNANKPVSLPIGWDGNYLFTAGSIRPARGLEDALWAMKHLVFQNVEIVGMGIAGEADARMIAYQKKLKNWVEKHNLSSKVRWAGNLNEKEMVWCYQNCRIFLMTSRVESFGHIAVEAMAHGCVCISANNPCLPEIFGDVAIYYPPKNGKALSEVIQTVLSWDNKKRNEMSVMAKKRAAQFSWNVCAEATVEELKKAIALSNKRPNKNK